jgi:transposase
VLEAAYAQESPEMLRCHDSIEILRLVWLQQYYRQDGQVQLRQVSNMPSGEQLIQSPYDLEARFSMKRQTTWVGYKTHITETCETAVHLITNVETTPATSPDSAVTLLIHESLSEKSLLPEQHLVDVGYVDAELLVTCRKEYGVELVGPVLSDNSWQAKEGNGFDLSSFHIEWESRKATCPQGYNSYLWSESEDTYNNAVIHVRFAAKTCKACPCRAKCTQAKTGGRSLKLRPQEQHEALQEARQREHSPEFKKLYNKRAGVEGSISQAVRVCDLRHTRYIGTAKTHLQHILSAIGLNILRFVDWVNERPHAKTRTSAFAAVTGG